jgi:transcriptional regulator with XRE-family HTH domain
MTPRRAESAAERARTAAGYSVEQAARYCRTTPSAIRRLERAGRGWSDERAERLARLYGCSIEAFPAGGKTRPLSPSVLAAIRREG